MPREREISKLVSKIQKDAHLFRVLRKDCKYYKFDHDWEEMSCFHNKDHATTCHSFLCPLSGTI